ncbi:MAG TPA: serine/threonine-protein kinase [Micromonospora sp.]|nr:serine/threonine-protein kinase [Micromonospora sp.]
MTQIPTRSGGSVTPTYNRAAPGSTIAGRYALRAAVGHGGMGTVWRATDTLLRRDVAVKEVVLPPGLAPSDQQAMYERTLREARAAAALQHPAVVQVYDVVTESGRPWIVMELLDARSLAEMVLEDGPLAPRAVAKIGIALLGALEVAHAVGVLHRDVKPANVLICSDGRCVLTDFGVARMPDDVQLTTPGMVLGSPHFISPERAMGRDFGPPSDLFSLGVTLYTAVEGRPPFDKGDPIETMHSIVEDPPAPPSRSGVLTEVLLGLLEKDPAHRLDVTAARDKLRRLLAGPLASKAAPHLMTDPYAVVPAQRSPQPPPAPSAPALPSGQIGGRAMLQPGESLTDRLAQMQQGRTEPSAPSRTGLETPTGAMAPPSGTTDIPTGGMAPPAGSMDLPTSMLPAHPAATTRPVWASTGGQPSDAGGSDAPPSSPGEKLDKALAGMRRSGAGLAATIRSWPRQLQIGAAGGLAVVLLLGTILLLGDSDPEPATTPQANESSAPAGPDFETVTHSARGLSANVPKGWKKVAPKGAVYVDFISPDDPQSKLRILVEKSGLEPLGFMKQAGKILNDVPSCAKPYDQVQLEEVELAGRPAAELEYTCGEGAEMRHGIWRAVVHDGKAYSFFLTTSDAEFADSKKYYDELVASFQLTEEG